MTNQYSLRINALRLRRVLEDTLKIVSKGPQPRQCLFTGTWILPSDWPYELSSTLIAWAILAREGGCRRDPCVVLDKQMYMADQSMAICTDPEKFREDLRALIDNGQNLDWEYGEQFVDRVLQPIQLIQNLLLVPLPAEEDGRTEFTITQLEESIRKYAPDFY